MDIITDLLKYLSSNFTPMEFIGVLAAILAIAYLGARYMLKSASKEDGLWEFLKGEESELELADIQDDIYKASRDQNVKLDEIEKNTTAILATLAVMQTQDKLNSETLDKHLAELREIQEFLEQTKEDAIKQFDEIKHQFKMHDLHDHQAFENLKNAIDDAVDTISSVNSQLEKINEYVRNAVPEFKMSHRELSKDISRLSRDLALIERSIENQINTTQRGINLR